MFGLYKWNDCTPRLIEMLNNLRLSECMLSRSFASLWMTIIYLIHVEGFLVKELLPDFHNHEVCG